MGIPLLTFFQTFKTAYGSSVAFLFSLLVGWITVIFAASDFYAAMRAASLAGVTLVPKELV